MEVTFCERLQIEFDARKARNPRYSLRAFAAALKVEHSTLSQILRRTRPVPPGRIRAWARNLGMMPEEAAVYIAACHAESPEGRRRAQQLLNWTSEALAVMDDSIHYDLLRLTRTPAFQPDVRWISAETRVSIDQVNTALTRLLRLRLLEMAPGKWKELTGCAQLTESKFRSIALERVRQSAAESGIESANGE